MPNSLQLVVCGRGTAEELWKWNILFESTGLDFQRKVGKGCNSAVTAMKQRNSLYSWLDGRQSFRSPVRLWNAFFKSLTCDTCSVMKCQSLLPFPLISFWKVKSKTIYYLFRVLLLVTWTNLIWITAPRFSTKNVTFYYWDKLDKARNNHKTTASAFDPCGCPLAIGNDLLETCVLLWGYSVLTSSLYTQTISAKAIVCFEDAKVVGFCWESPIVGSMKDATLKQKPRDSTALVV